MSVAGMMSQSKQHAVGVSLPNVSLCKGCFTHQKESVACTVGANSGFDQIANHDRAKIHQILRQPQSYQNQMAETCCVKSFHMFNHSLANHSAWHSTSIYVECTGSLAASDHVRSARQINRDALAVHSGFQNIFRTYTFKYPHEFGYHVWRFSSTSMAPLFQT